MQTRSHTHRRRGGFSLIELVGAAALLSVVIGTVGLVQMRSRDAARARLAEELAESICRRALDRVAEELENIDPGLLVPNPDSERATSSLTYQHVTGLSQAGGATHDAPCRLSLQLTRGEFANDLDDNGDGLVDERRLVLTREVGASHPIAIDLCNGIPEFASDQTPGGEPGFCIRRNGNELTLRLTVRVPCAHGAFASSTQQTSVALHD